MVQKYANADANGKIIAYYTDDIHTPEQIPETAFPITDEEWQDSVANPGKYEVQLGKLVLAPLPSEAVVLEQYKRVKIDLLSGYRDTELTAGFTSTVTRGGVALKFSYTEKSQTRFMKQLAIVAANPSLNAIDWLTTNGGFVTLTRDEFISITNSGAAHEITIEFKFLYAQANIMNALDKNAVDLIVAGW